MLQKRPCHAITTPLAPPVVPLCSYKGQDLPGTGKAVLVPIPDATPLFQPCFWRDHQELHHPCPGSWAGLSPNL